MKQVHSILIVKTSAIGDVIQTFGALDYLRNKWPTAQIDWVVETGIADLLRAHPRVDHVIAIDTKVWRKAPFLSKTHQEIQAFREQLRSTHYDVLFDFQGNIKSSFVTAQARAEKKVGYGWASVREKCNLLVTHQKYTFTSDISIRLKYLGLVQSYFRDTIEYAQQGVRLKLKADEQQRLNQIVTSLRTNPLMICFGSKWENKKISIETWLELLNKIAQDDFSFVIIYANAAERCFAEKLVGACAGKAIAVGDLSLPLWQTLMWEVKGVIAMDSAALHLCATTHTPSLSVFGPSLARVYKPLGDKHVAVQGTCPYQKSFAFTCPALRSCMTGACIKSMQADELYSSFKNWYYSNC